MAKHVPPVQPHARAIAQAIEIANATPYGLADAVMSRDAERCRRVALALHSGTVWQNCSQVIFPSTPFGGAKESGFGKEFGVEGLREYLSAKTVTGTESGHSWQWYGPPPA